MKLTREVRAAGVFSASVRTQHTPTLLANVEFFRLFVRVLCVRDCVKQRTQERPRRVHTPTIAMVYELFQSTFSVFELTSQSLVSLYDYLTTVAPRHVQKYVRKNVSGGGVRSPVAVAAQLTVAKSRFFETRSLLVRTDSDAFSHVDTSNVLYVDCKNCSLENRRRASVHAPFWPGEWWPTMRASSPQRSHHCANQHSTTLQQHTACFCTGTGGFARLCARADNDGDTGADWRQQ